MQPREPARLHDHRRRSAPHLARLPEELRAAVRRGRARARCAIRWCSTTCASTSRRDGPMPRIVLLPGDGIGPEIVAAAAPRPRGARRVRVRRAPGRRRLDRRTRHRAHRRGARGLPRRRRGPARRRRRARSGTRPTPTRRGPSRACSACARAWACSRTCARCSPSRALCSTPARCARADRGHRPAGRPRADRRASTSATRGRDGDRAHDTCAYTVAEIERIARVGLRGGGASARGRVTSVDKANVLETSRLWRETVDRLARRVRGRRARPHAGRQRRDAAGLAARPTST